MSRASRRFRSFCRVFPLPLLLAGAAFCAPVQDFPSRLTQPDGSSVPCLLSGDEFASVARDSRGFTLMQDPSSGWWVYAVKRNGKLVPTKFRAGRADPMRLGLLPRLSPEPAPLEKRRLDRARRTASTGLTPRAGKVHNLVVFIRFADEAEFPEGQSAFEPMFNGNPGTSSLRNYYREVSYGKLDITSTVVPVTPDGGILSYQDSHPRGYYQPYSAATNPDGYVAGTESTIEQSMLASAITALSSRVPSDLSLDSDSDGYVDHVTFIIRGEPSPWNSILWPHSSYLIYPAQVGALKVFQYDVQMEGMMLHGNVGGLCHEFFHSMGAPDLYHYTPNGIDPVGPWDLMGSPREPPQHMGAYMKWKYGGWLDNPPEAAASGRYSLQPLTSATGCCWKILSPSSGQYFVVEYRRKAGVFEASLPCSGLLVYRIVTPTTWSGGNSYGPPDEVYIYRPGGTLTANGYPGQAAYSADAGRTAITDTTDPLPFLANGTNGGLRITGIGPIGETISFDVQVPEYIYQLSFMTPPGNGWAGEPLIIQPKVTFSSPYSTGIVAAVPITLALQPGTGSLAAHLVGTTTVTAVNGVAAFTDLCVDTPGNGYKLVASAPGMAPVVAQAFSVAARDEQVLQRVSVSSAGFQSNGTAAGVTLSADGRIVAFADTGTNLSPANAAGYNAVYTHDRSTGITTCQSLTMSGAVAKGVSTFSLSADGRYVTFASTDPGVVPGITGGVRQAYRRDTMTGEVRCISVAADGTAGNRESRPGLMSADGRYVAFYSLASNLVAGDTNGTWDVFVCDTSTNTISRASATVDGVQVGGDTVRPALSLDGRYVAFTSMKPNLPYTSRVYLHDLVAGTTRCMGVAADGTVKTGRNPSVSRDGRYVAFDTYGGYSEPGDMTSQVYVQDTLTGELTCVSTDLTGHPGRSHSTSPSLSADGQRVAFLSSAALLPGALPAGNIYVRDRALGLITLASLDAFGTAAYCSGGALSADGSRVAFLASGALVPDDTNGKPDAYVRGPLAFPAVTLFFDAVRALRFAAGLSPAAPEDVAAVKGQPTPAAITLADALGILRRFWRL